MKNQALLMLGLLFTVGMGFASDTGPAQITEKVFTVEEPVDYSMSVAVEEVVLTSYFINQEAYVIVSQDIITGEVEILVGEPAKVVNDPGEVQRFEVFINDYYNSFALHRRKLGESNSLKYNSMEDVYLKTSSFADGH